LGAPPCLYVSDCNGDCGGDAVEDECGVCDGDGIVPDGYCDCNGAVEDCAGNCGIVLNVELWGECYNIVTTTELDLSDAGLNIQIPPELWTLTNLEQLNLGNNNLTGIPPEIGCEL